MALRCRSLQIFGWTCILLLGSLAGRSLSAQDRGAPRFGPATPADTIQAEASDAGRLWSLAQPPFDRFERRYGMTADSAWATHLRGGLLRLPNCTAALVSDQGLALTTARCVRRHLDAASDDEAVVAEEPPDERALPGLHADRLVDATDMTAAVQAAQQDTAVYRAVQTVQQRLQSEAGTNQRVEVGSAGGGAHYTAYTYRRYEDVRIVFLPERSVSAFGGIDAAMTYPRPAFDVALLRVYTPDGTPLAPNHFFETPTQGVRPGDVVFAAGHSNETRRAESAAQLAVRRDLTLPHRQAFLDTWTRALRAYLDSADTTAPQRDALHEGERALKRTRARLDALQNEYVMTRLRKRDARFREALRRDASLEKRYGGLLDSLAALQGTKRSLASAYRAFGRFGDSQLLSGSSTFRRILRARRQADTGSVPSDGKTTLEDPMAAEDSVGRHPAPVEAALLAARLEAVRNHLLPDTAAVRRLLQGQSPTERAAEIVNNSSLATPSNASAGAATAVVPPDDPAAAVVDVVAPRARSFFEEWRALTRAERRLTRRLARARQAVRAAPVLPSGQNTPRLTDGRVLGYPYNGTTAPPLTTVFGLYAQNHSFGGEASWGLPDRWRRASAEMDRSMPLTLAASTDGAAGTRGAPLLNQYLEIVGVTIGTNVQGAAGTYIYLPERMRTVAVDVRGLREALTSVYGAEALVEELFGGASSTTE